MLLATNSVVKNVQVSNLIFRILFLFFFSIMFVIIWRKNKNITKQNKTCIFSKVVFKTWLPWNPRASTDKCKPWQHYWVVSVGCYSQGYVRIAYFNPEEL